jgi:histidine ammonia-lyase
MKKIVLSADGLSLEDLVAVARKGAGVALSEKCKKAIRKSRNLVEQWVRQGKIVYGMTTGFGALSDVVISKGDTRKLQQNVLMSPAAGVGPALEEDAVRAVMALRIKDFARGNAGIRLETGQNLIGLLNENVCPVVPEKGSVGASGDLAPLAHLSLVLVGVGEVFY